VEENKSIFLLIKMRNDAIIAQSVSFRFHSYFARYGTLRIAQGSFLYYKSTTYTLFKFSPDFYIIFCAFLQINRQMSTFSYYRKRQCFRLIFVPTRIRIQESPINADPEHFFSQKLERENKLKAIKLSGANRCTINLP
jgi:hypothetical protein